ncbi:MAG: hypothetical protein ACLFQ8_01350 [Candidatus Aenigmatarchaeota archaeon]
MNEVMVDFFGTGLGDEFFVYALPWLLVFALVYGMLSQIGKEGIPSSDSARVVIATVLAFFSLLFAKPLMVFLQAMGGSTIVILTGFLFFLILLELTGVGAMNFINDHPGKFGLVILIIIVTLFMGSGGIEMIGLGNIANEVNPTTVFFLVIVALSIWWMVRDEGNGKNSEGNKKQSPPKR